ncbi:hypothetical protein EGW35_13245 [Enterococcus durans]|uniref:hypothetical protein n=1 Tax=Enterococcus durans TaxID=53345 RepID=UPI000F4DA830|nr:hypothetical protein [Enterococcus durans]NJE65053.1 hypothetical protein [Enterococcus durans]ROX80060.1 hypothetical protein EGW35_13245 [Enterococcus durans]
MNLRTPQDIQDWCLKNLLTRQEAAKITKQSYSSFSQSVNLKYIQPFLEYGSGTGTVRLYLKSDIETYAKQLQAKKQRQQ